MDAWLENKKIRTYIAGTHLPFDAPQWTNRQSDVLPPSTFPDQLGSLRHGPASSNRPSKWAYHSHGLPHLGTVLNRSNTCRCAMYAILKWSNDDDVRSTTEPGLVVRNVKPTQWMRRSEGTRGRFQRPLNEKLGDTVLMFSWSPGRRAEGDIILSCLQCRSVCTLQPSQHAWADVRWSSHS